ncbi:lipopolysaccharide assembly protein LapB [Thorsellia kenyensis]|uniref:Lipopolysaccharide assembly protein B n=1 Tax=Thorsellia kenyensis TaxID=1549888 RepID=A0ABV6C8Z2_9GAMM
MLELLFLLLPIAVAYGWYMGKRSVKYEKQSDEERISKNIVNGINFLLSDQKEQALELFSALAKEKGDDFEAHLTLGNLLRTRGQIDSALQIHESILASDALTFEQRLLAKEHLGKTYLQAGLLDRAETIFNSLLDEDDYKIHASKQLLTIHQSTSEWDKALIYAKNLLKTDGDYYETIISQIYCELATIQLNNKNHIGAVDNLKYALKIDNRCARASLMLAKIFREFNSPYIALFFYQKILEQDELILLDSLEIIINCYTELNADIESIDEHSKFLSRLDLKPEDIKIMSLLDFLHNIVEQDIGSEAHIFYVNFLREKDQLNAAIEHLKKSIFKRPTLKLLKLFIELQIESQSNANTHTSLMILRDIINEQIMKKPKYRCRGCGFASHTLYWHCPSCKQWASIYLIKGIDGQ